MAIMKRKRKRNSKQSSTVNIVTNSALAYLHDTVSQEIRNQYTGEIKDTDNTISSGSRVSVLLKHTCGMRIVESELLPDGASTPAAHEIGISLAKKLIKRIRRHGNACDTLSKQAVSAVTSIKGEWVGDVVYDDRLTKAKKPKPKKECEICGQQDTTKYPEWPECNHVREDATTSREKGVANKRATKKKPRAKNDVRRTDAAVQRAKDRTAKRQGPVDGPRKPTRGKVRRNFG